MQAGATEGQGTRGQKRSSVHCCRPEQIALHGRVTLNDQILRKNIRSDAVSGSARTTCASVTFENTIKKVDNRLVMPLAVVITVLALSATSLVAQARSGGSAPAAGQAQPALEVMYEGELETYVAVGGESTGWRLRRRTAEGRRQYIELLVTAELAQGLRANTRVRVRGTMQMRHYVERGDVQVLAVKDVIEVARR
jgi:hypothetical protein